MAENINVQDELRDEDIPVQQFLLQTHLFRFLKIGPLCNGSRSFAFSEAQCDLSLAKKNTPKGRWYAIPMKVLFQAGYRVLEELTDKDKSPDISKGEKKALNILIDFLKQKELHEKNILSALEKMNAEKSNKETTLSMALAEHLLGKLSPGQSYVIDSRMKGIGNCKCSCGCGKTISTGSTGIGHPEVWHGFIDIMMSAGNKPLSAANVCLGFDTHMFDGPTDAKRAKLSDETGESDSDEDEESTSESVPGVKLNMTGLESIQDQAVAQTIVFALNYEKKNPGSKTFVPNIVICPSKFYIVMYEPENDILVWSKEFPLFGQADSTLQEVSVIALWMALHYEIFCNGADIFEEVEEVKACFRDRIDPKHWTNYQQLEIGISTFDDIPRLNLAQSLFDLDFDLPKLKLKNIHLYPG